MYHECDRHREVAVNCYVSVIFPRVRDAWSDSWQLPSAEPEEGHFAAAVLGFYHLLLSQLIIFSWSEVSFEGMSLKLLIPQLSSLGTGRSRCICHHIVEEHESQYSCPSSPVVYSQPWHCEGLATTSYPCSLWSINFYQGGVVWVCSFVFLPLWWGVHIPDSTEDPEVQEARESKLP